MTLATPDLKALRALKDRAGREAAGQFLVEGEHLAQEAVATGHALSLYLPLDARGRYPALESAGLPVHYLTDKAFLSLSETRSPQGIIALCRLPDTPDIGALGPVTVALAAVQDPGNVGTVWRSLWATGLGGLLCDRLTADPFSGKAFRAAMGAGFHVPCLVAQDLEKSLFALKKAGVTLVACAGDGDSLFDRPLPQGPLCLMLGNEGQGLPETLFQMADTVVALPMPGGAESLNVAVAGSVLLYDRLRTGPSK